MVAVMMKTIGYHRTLLGHENLEVFRSNVLYDARSNVSED